MIQEINYYCSHKMNSGKINYEEIKIIIYTEL
jgi:hypothetical protein